VSLQIQKVSCGEKFQVFKNPKKTGNLRITDCYLFGLTDVSCFIQAAIIPEDDISLVLISSSYGSVHFT